MKASRALSPAEMLYVTASAVRHRASRQQSWTTRMLGFLAPAAVAIVIGLLSTWWIGTGLLVFAAMISIGEDRQRARTLAKARTIWDPPDAGWVVREWKLQVERVEAIVGPPEDYDTFVVFHLVGGRKFACSLWAITLGSDRIPEEVGQVAFSEVHLRKLEPRGPLLPAWFSTDPVPSVLREDTSWSPAKEIGYTRGPSSPATG